MSLNFKRYKFISSSIVGWNTYRTRYCHGNKKENENKVHVFIGDMTYETGVFHECYKYSKNFKLPIKFIVEDNNLSTNTPTNYA